MTSAHAQTDWTLRNPNAPPTTNLNALAWSGSTLLVAGDSGSLASSGDAVSWVPQASGVTTALQGLTANNNLIVAVGAGGVIRTTPGNNPGTWSQRTSNTPAALRAVTFNNGPRYVAVGAGGVVATSTNGTTGWATNPSGTSQNLNAVEFGNNLYVAAGDSGVIITSTTGQNPWTFRTSGTTNPLHRVRWANNLFVAVGTGGVLLTSTNGTAWTSRTSNKTVPLRGAARSNNLWVVVGDSGTIITSSDGTTNWTSRTSGTTAPLSDVVWTGDEFVAAGAGGVLLTSPNGTAWTLLARYKGVLNGLAWNGSLYAAAGAGGTVLTSPNGTTWTLRNSNSLMSLNAVDTGAGLFVAVGAAGTILSSSNGTDWIARTSGVAHNLNFVRRGGGRFVAVGAAGTIVTSTNGTTWTSQASGTTDSLYAVEWTGTQYIAAGANGTVLASADGALWTPRSSGTTATLRALRWTSDSRLIAAGAGGLILMSSDGASWALQPVGATADLRSLALLNGRIVAVGANGAVMSSPNGVTWSGHNSGVTAALNTVHWNGSQFVAAGAEGFILTSPGTAATAPPAVPSLTTPAQNATGIALTVQLIWTTSGPTGAGGNTYRAQLSTRPDFATLLVDDSTRIGNTVAANNLQSNTAYYWRVRSKNNGNAGNSSFWSETGLFSTGGLAAPVLTSPAAGATGIAASATLTWEAVAGVTAYRAQLSTTSSFAAPLIDDSTLTGTSRGVTGLQANTVYYWRVSAKNASGASAWSSARTFTTVSAAPAAPTLTAPAQNATAVSVFAELSWSSVNAATTYRVQLALDSSFAAPQLDDSTLTATSRIPGQLLGNTVYYWRARASNLVGPGAWSGTRRFTTGPVPTAAPPAPTLTAPAMFATGVSLTPQMTWSVLVAASRYRIQVSLAADFSSVTVDDSSLSSAQKTLSALQGNVDYYWRVNGRNFIGTGPWSDVGTFRTVVSIPTAAPVLSAPVQFVTGVPLPAQLSWNAVSGAATYRVQVSTAPDFAALVYENTGATGTSAAASGLVGNTDYYWRVAARNTAGTGPYSSIWKFTTGALPAPEAPTLVAPVQFETGVIQGRVMSWTAVSLATSYRVQVSASTAFATLVFDDSTMTSPSRALGGTLQPSTIYYWRARAKNAAGVSAWTSPWSFTTAAQLPNAVLEQVSLSRVQDARGGMVRFGLPHAARVSLRLRDMRGRVTALVLDQTLDAGWHVVRLPAGSEAGLGILEFRADDDRRIMILGPSSF